MRKLRTLLIDDSWSDVERLVRHLRDAGYEVVYEHVRTRAELIAALQRDSWNLVLSDISTQGLHAAETLAILREKQHDLPLIVVSAAVAEQEAVAALRAGAHDFVFKHRRARLVPAIERELRAAAHRREQREAQHALDRSETQYRSLIDNAVFGIYRATVDGRFLTVNPALVSMLGYESPDELLQVGLASLYADEAGEESAPSTGRVRSEFLGTEAVWRRKSGTTIRVRLTRLLTQQRHAGTPEFEVIVEDIAEEHALQEQLRVGQKMEALGRLAGGVAHDFNNLLTAILGYTELLADQIGPDKPIGADLQQIKSAAERATALTKQLLAFSRKQVLAVKPVDLSDVVTSLGTLLRRVLGAHIAFETSLCDSLPRVMADPSQMQHLLINLAVNSRDAMPNGGVITIGTHVMDAEFVPGSQAAAVRTRLNMKAGSYAALTVTDVGIGMSREVRERVFEPFFTTKERGHGTGLGLAAVYGTVKQLGGYIDVESSPGKGSRFTIYLPAAGQAAPAVPQATLPAPVRGRETILLVDDEPSVRTLATTVLERAGYRVLQADSAEAALSLLADHAEPIHLLLTDVVLPGMNGHDLASHVARSRPGVRRMLMSGYAAQLGGFEGLFGPGVNILEKPFSGETLLARTREALAPDVHPGAAA